MVIIENKKNQSFGKNENSLGRKRKFYFCRRVSGLKHGRTTPRAPSRKPRTTKTPPLLSSQTQPSPLRSRIVCKLRQRELTAAAAASPLSSGGVRVSRFEDERGTRGFVSGLLGMKHGSDLWGEGACHGRVVGSTFPPPHGMWRKKIPPRKEDVSLRGW